MSDTITDDSPKMECSDCLGSGYLYRDNGPSGDTLDCPECDGEGWLVDRAEIERRADEAADVEMPIHRRAA